MKHATIRSAGRSTGRTAGAAAALVLLTASAVAQTHPSFPDSASFRSLGLAGTFGNTSAGHVLGTTRVDVVLMVGSQPVLLVGPEAYNAHLVLPVAANDAAVIPTGGGSADVLTVGPTGLTRFAWQPLAEELVGWPAGDTTWRDACELEIGDLDGDGQDDVLGLSAPRIEVLVRYGSGAGLVPGASILATRPVDDVVPLDLDGDGDLEVACLTEGGLEVYHHGGEPALLLPGWPGGGFATSIRRPGGDQIALVVPDPAGGQRLVVANAAGVLVEVPLGAIDAVAGISGDLDGDGDGDLLLSHRSAPELLCLVNQSGVVGAPLFAADQTRTVSVDQDGYVPSLNAARPLVLDVEGDGDLDVLHPLQGTGGYAIAASRVVDELQLQPNVIAGAYTHDALIGDGRLDLMVRLPADRGDMTHFELCVWRRLDPYAYTEPTAFHRELIALPSAPGLAVGFTTGEADYFDTQFFLELRLVALDSASNVVASKPTATPGFALGATLQAMYDVSDLDPWTPLIEIATYGFLDDPLDTYNSASGGGVVPLPGVPDLPPDEAPAKPDETP